MPKAKGKAAAGQKTMTSTGFYPMLPKPAAAVGKCSSVLGKFWSGCPSKDKDKRFECAVIEFIALHDFGEGKKGAGFQLKEMDEDGRGSLRDMCACHRVQRGCACGRICMECVSPISVAEWRG